MIMQSRTPRSLSWAGVLAVLALGLFLLPLLPALAQDDNKQGDGTDRKIEELKKQLQALEEQKQADKKKSEAENKLRQAADVKKARHEVEALAKELQAKRGELQKLEERHNAALARLAELEGTHTRGYTFSPDGKTTYQFVRDGKITYQFGPNGSEGIWYAPDAAKRVTENTWKTYTVPSEGKPIEVFFTTTPSKPDQKSQKSGRTAQHGAADKSADLERKLDRLSKELEELRRELKQNRGNGGN